MIGQPHQVYDELQGIDCEEPYRELAHPNIESRQVRSDELVVPTLRVGLGLGSGSRLLSGLGLGLILRLSFTLALYPCVCAHAYTQVFCRSYRQ